MPTTARPKRAPRAKDAAKANSEFHFGALNNLAGFAIRCMNLHLGAGLDAVVGSEGLKPHQFTALSLIVDNPDISQSDLAQALAIKPSNMVPLIDEMEAREFVRRYAAATNRRSYALRATEQGKQMRDHTLDIISRHEDSLLAFMTDQERDLIKGLTGRLYERSRA